MITTVFGGAVCFRLGERRVVVEEGFYLVANASHSRAIEPGATMRGELLSILPHEDFVREAMSAGRLSTTAGASGTTPSTRAPRFIESTQPHDDFVSPHLLALRQAIQGGPMQRAFAENVVSEMLRGLARRDSAFEESAARIPRARAGTRAEIFSRLQRGREHMESSYGQIRSLAEVASAASMSYAHFNRFFSACYGVTPHRYLTERRLDVALRELRRNQLSITELSYVVGFDNVNSFTALFQRRFGLLPSQFRRGAPIHDERLAAPRGPQPRIARPDPVGRSTFEEQNNCA